MSRVLLVRHGQASHTADDYDQLSELGYRQARCLGEQWAAEGLLPDAVYVGPRKRHRQTFEALAEEVDSGWPEPRYLDGWDEHEAFDVVMYSIPRLAESDSWVAERDETRQAGGHEGQLAYFDLYKHITRRWVLGQLDLDGSRPEPWPDFRRRVHAALNHVLETEGRGKSIAVFTSSGPVSVAAGRALDLDDEGTMVLSWLVQNISVTEVLWREDGMALKTFNALPRLVGEGLRTLV